MRQHQVKEYLHYRGTRGRRERNVVENLFEEIMTTVLNLGKKIEIQEVQRVPNKMNLKSHIIIKG